VLNRDAMEALIVEAQATREDYAAVEPTALGWTPEGAIAIAFSDGREATLSPSFLRAACPCAECRGTHGTPPKAFHIISPAKMAQAARQTQIVATEPMGTYAIGITWGDGHKEGIYTWSYLRALAERS